MTLFILSYWLKSFIEPSVFRNLQMRRKYYRYGLAYMKILKVLCSGFCPTSLTLLDLGSILVLNSNFPQTLPPLEYFSFLHLLFIPPVAWLRVA